MRTLTIKALSIVGKYHLSVNKSKRYIHLDQAMTLKDTLVKEIVRIFWFRSIRIFLKKLVHTQGILNR
jgi:hypothetical protein